MNTIGIDYSTKKVAIVALAPDSAYPSRRLVARSMALTAREKDYDANFASVMQYAEDVVSGITDARTPDDREYRVAIEAPIIGMSGAAQTAIRMAMVCGALLNMCNQYFGYGMVSLVPVSTWKKKVVGAGNAKKEDVHLWLQDRHIDAVDHLGTDDLRDAYCLALYAASMEKANDRA